MCDKHGIPKEFEPCSLCEEEYNKVNEKIIGVNKMINILKLWIMSDTELARIKHDFYCRGIASERKFNK